MKKNIFLVIIVLLFSVLNLYTCNDENNTNSPWEEDIKQCENGQLNVVFKEHEITYCADYLLPAYKTESSLFKNKNSDNKATRINFIFNKIEQLTDEEKTQNPDEVPDHIWNLIKNSKIMITVAGEDKGEFDSSKIFFVMETNHDTFSHAPFNDKSEVNLSIENYGASGEEIIGNFAGQIISNEGKIEDINGTFNVIYEEE